MVRSETQRRRGEERYAKHEGRTQTVGERLDRVSGVGRRTTQAARRSIRSTLKGKSRSRTRGERSRTGGH